MKPDYKNWVPKSIVFGLLAGTGISPIAAVLTLLRFPRSQIRVILRHTSKNSAIVRILTRLEQVIILFTAPPSSPDP